MLPISYVREHPETIKASEKKRGRDPSVVDTVLTYDQDWRSALKKLEKLKQTRNLVSEEINAAKKAKKEDIAQQKILEMKKVASSIREQEDHVEELLDTRNKALNGIGNVLHESVPVGEDDSKNKEIKQVGDMPLFDFEIKDHIELGLSLDLFDLETAAKVSGSRFVYMKKEAVLLDLALQRFAIDTIRQQGFEMVAPPFMLNRAALEGGVNLSEFQDTIYKIDEEDLYLIGTSEHPLVALKKDAVIDEQELPIKIGGISTCFRKELGAHGRDDKGIFRVHQFNKIEMVVYSKPENSYTHFDHMQQISEEIFTRLGIPFRVVNICTGDLGNKQALQYDIEAWFPGQNGKKGSFREVTSCSNCTTYQAVTLNTKIVRRDGIREYAHTLNNTAIATSRVIASILENFQQADGSVKVPEVLWPYMSGIQVIRPVLKP